MSKKAKKRSNSLQIPKLIIYTAKFLQSISLNLLTTFAARLFTTPLRYKLPKREHEMDAQSAQEKLFVPAIAKEIVTYCFGNGSKKILLVHGWSGRGTQLVKIAERLAQLGFSTVSFDAPAHGKSPGSTTLMPEFIEAILEIGKKFGPFEAAVGHSLGGMSLLNAVKRGFGINSLVIIGSGDKISDILIDFVNRMQLRPPLVDALRDHFEAGFSGQTMEEFSAYIAAEKVDIPVLVVHDKDDEDVPVECAVNIHKHLKNATLLLTQGLGHRKILGDAAVIEKTVDFIKNKEI